MDYEVVITIFFASLLIAVYWFVYSRPTGKFIYLSLVLRGALAGIIGCSFPLVVATNGNGWAAAAWIYFLWVWAIAGAASAFIIFEVIEKARVKANILIRTLLGSIIGTIVGVFWFAAIYGNNEHLRNFVGVFSIAAFCCCATVPAAIIAVEKPRRENP